MELLASYTYKLPSSYPYQVAKILKPNYVRIRCPVCGMLARLSNIDREHTLDEEMDTYCLGRAHITHIRKLNPNLRQYWIKKLLKVLKRLGWKEKEEAEHPYQYKQNQRKGVKMNYVYQEKAREGSYPYEKG